MVGFVQENRDHAAVHLRHSLQEVREGEERLLDVFQARQFPNIQLAHYLFNELDRAGKIAAIQLNNALLLLPLFEHAPLNFSEQGCLADAPHSHDRETSRFVPEDVVDLSLPPEETGSYYRRAVRVRGQA